ncbi:hypothetical protein NDU88_006204 [Pleurodeles waltl]|uniref:Uncharacterized protein n=1 Tax=Pleurodeles waltl TaxID=8319 RepID=A0AAV7QL27_PLEWA|nr:hypothetical protein NDU88_006204 [Pleurodeles waltl]
MRVSLFPRYRILFFDPHAISSPSANGCRGRLAYQTRQPLRWSDGRKGARGTQVFEVGCDEKEATMFHDAWLQRFELPQYCRMVLVCSGEACFDLQRCCGGAISSASRWVLPVVLSDSSCKHQVI